MRNQRLLSGWHFGAQTDQQLRVAKCHERLSTGVELGNRKAACRDRQNGLNLSPNIASIACLKHGDHFDSSSKKPAIDRIICTEIYI